MSELSTYNFTPAIGEIYMMQFEGKDSKQNGWRPGLVLQNNVGNVHSPNIIALPLTSVIKKINQPTHVVLLAEDTGLVRDSMVLCENPETIPKARVGEYMATLSHEYMKKIATASSVATAVISYLTISDLLDLWYTSIRLNRRRADITTMR